MHSVNIIYDKTFNECKVEFLSDGHIVDIESFGNAERMGRAVWNWLSTERGKR